MAAIRAGLNPLLRQHEAGQLGLCLSQGRPRRGPRRERRGGEQKAVGPNRKQLSLIAKARFLARQSHRR